MLARSRPCLPSRRAECPLLSALGAPRSGGEGGIAREMTPHDRGIVSRRGRPGCHMTSGSRGIGSRPYAAAVQTYLGSSPDVSRVEPGLMGSLARARLACDTNESTLHPETVGPWITTRAGSPPAKIRRLPALVSRRVGTGPPMRSGWTELEPTSVWRHIPIEAEVRPESSGVSSREMTGGIPMDVKTDHGRSAVASFPQGGRGLECRLSARPRWSLRARPFARPGERGALSRPRSTPVAGRLVPAPRRRLPRC